MLTISVCEEEVGVKSTEPDMMLLVMFCEENEGVPEQKVENI